jgi:hypothetical protein
MSEDSRSAVPEPERERLAQRLIRRGVKPDIACELRRRLDEAESSDHMPNGISSRNLILYLLRPPGRKKTIESPLRLDDLRRDPVRVRGNQIRTLKTKCEELSADLDSITRETEATMLREDSDNAVSNLQASRIRVQEELQRAQADLNRLLMDDSAIL